MEKLEGKYRELQKQNKIRIVSNKTEGTIDEKLIVTIIYSCGHEEKIPLFSILEHPQDYETLLYGDTVFQKTLRCNTHCHRKLQLLKLKPLKNDKNLQEIWNLEHGRMGTADITIKVV
jgi:hypothetical protein